MANAKCFVTATIHLAAPNERRKKDVKVCEAHITSRRRVVAVTKNKQRSCAKAVSLEPIAPAPKDAPTHPNPHHHTHTLFSPIAQLAEALVLETSDGGSNPSWGTHPSIVYGAPAPLLTTSPWDHVSRGKQKANAQFFENQIFLCKSEKNLRFPGIFFRFHL